MNGGWGKLVKSMQQLFLYPYHSICGDVGDTLDIGAHTAANQAVTAAKAEFEFLHQVSQIV